MPPEIRVQVHISVSVDLSSEASRQNFLKKLPNILGPQVRISPDASEAYLHLGEGELKVAEPLTPAIPRDTPVIPIEEISGLDFGKAYRYFRQIEGISQVHAARLARVNPATVNRIESSARRRSRPGVVVRLIRSLGWQSGDPRIKMLLEKATEGRENPQELIGLYAFI